MELIEKIPYKTAFVVNPAGGGGKSGRIWPQIAQLLDRSGQPFLAYFTRSNGEGTQLAVRAVAEGAELVVAVGGDGTISEDNALLAVIANGSYYGGRFAIAPQAAIDDGILDLIVVRKRTGPKTTLLAAQVLAGKHLESSAVFTAQSKRFRLSADHPVPVHIDGEVIGSLPVEIMIRPSALRILLPPDKLEVANKLNV